MKIDVSITGIADVNDILMNIAPREARNLLRATVYDMAGQAAQMASTFSPDNPSTGAGDLHSSIKPKRERGSRDKIEASVIVTNLHRNFFWRFLEYGQGPDHVQHAMFGKTLMAFQASADKIYMESFTRKLVARLTKLAKKAG